MTLLILLLIVNFSLLLLFLFLSWRWSQQLQELKNDPRQREMRDLFREWIQEALREMRQAADKSEQTRREIQERLDKTGEHINRRLDNAARIIGQIGKELGEISEIGRQMRSLQEMMSSPKLRGNIGEQILYDLLKQQLSQQQFKIQYRFRSGQIVDAAIITDRGILAVDAKFPMENFRKLLQAESESEREQARRDFVNDVRKHIRAIASKYILPQEGTLDFAMMYVPSEAVAYEITVHLPDLAEYAYQQRVVIVSPNQFNYYLKVILLGLEGKKIEEKARFILRSLQAIRQDSEKLGESLNILLRHVTNAKNKADEVVINFDRLQGKITSVQQLEEKQFSLPLSE